MARTGFALSQADEQSLTAPQAHNERAMSRFHAIRKQLPELLDALIKGEAYRRGLRPAVPHVEGVYLFTEDGVHRYVGRTRNANRRLGEHTRPSAPENSAPFAFNIAKADAETTGTIVSGTRKEVARSASFGPLFAAAKERVRAMEFRVVEIDQKPALSSVFEVYASMALETEGAFNLFETH
jgi:hypothetical protein